MKLNIPYGRQNITDEDIDAVINSLKSDFLTQGPLINEFEKDFAKYVGSKYAVAVSNGTAALHMSTLALGVQEGTKVITTPITFAASANCVKYCGGDVEFVDIDHETQLININEIEKILRANPTGTFSGIIPVDFAGYPVNLQKLRKLADEFGMWIIEDACHSPGGYFFDDSSSIQRCGNGEFADLAVFSFHPVKHIATGEGGMITTNDENLYNKLLLLRSHGITKDPILMQQNHGGWFYEMQLLGYNYRITDFQAALGLSQLKRADKGIDNRIRIVKKYYEAFKEIKSINVKEYIEGHAYHLYVIKSQNRLELYNYLKSKGINCQVHYIPVHTLPYYQTLGYKKGDFPISEEYYEHCLSIPIYPTLSDEEQDYVIESIIEFAKNE